MAKGNRFPHGGLVVDHVNDALTVHPQGGGFEMTIRSDEAKDCFMNRPTRIRTAAYIRTPFRA